MPLELVVMGFAVAALVAIAVRFASRDEGGERRLPRVIDESVGMFAIRRALGRPTEAASDRDAARAEAETNAAAEAAARLHEDEIAYRIGVPGAPPPTLPSRFVVSKAPPQAHPIPPVVPVATRSVAGARPMARRGAAALPLQRRIAGVFTVLVVVLAAFAAQSLPRGPQGEVLSATGTPGASDAPADSGAPTDAIGGPSDGSSSDAPVLSC